MKRIMFNVWSLLLALLLLASPLHAQHERGPGNAEHYGLFHHLEGVIVALKKLGRGEEAKKVTEFAGELKRSLGRAGGRGEKGRRERSGADRERQAARRQVEIMAFASRVLADVGNESAAKSLRRAAAGIETRLAGKRPGNLPSRRENMTHLRMAAGALGKAGKRDKAEAVGKLARQFYEQDQRSRGNRKRTQERDRRREEEREEAREEKGEHGERRRVVRREVRVERRSRKGERDEREEEEEDEDEDDRGDRREQRGRDRLQNLEERLRRLEKIVGEMRRDVQRLRDRRTR